MKRLHPASAIKQAAFEGTVAELKRKVEEVVVRGFEKKTKIPPCAMCRFFDILCNRSPDEGLRTLIFEK